MKPITKAEVSENVAGREFPDFVIQAFNECITESKAKGSSDVMQDDVLKRIRKLGKVSTDKIFKENWLDVEEHYRKAGWDVHYDKPGFNESYKASFTFK